MMKRKKKISRYLRERKLLQNKQRKILSLEERVQAIHLYDQNPVYMHVASAFQCSWEQIKNVIQDRDAILDYYARCQTAKANDNPRLARQQKINFLGKVMYEYIKRVYFYRTGVLNDVAIRDRALMFRDILKIENFVPNKAWISDFKQAYNLDFDQLDSIAVTQQPPQSTNCEDIVAYCSKNEKHEQPLLRETTTAIEGVSTAAEPVEKDTHVSQPIDLNFIDDVDNHIVFNHAEAEDNDFENYDSELESDDDVEDFNENEDGPTIDFGDFDHNVEDVECVSILNDDSDLAEQIQVSAKIKRMAPKSRQMAVMEPQEAFKEIETATEVQQKPTQEKPIPSRTLLTAQLKPPQAEPPTETTSSTSTHGGYLNSSLRKRLNHDGYAAALEILQPLEEYALLQEDFPAINLLSQLMTVYRRGIKRKMRTST